MASATISRYRGSKMWSGRNTFGKSTTFGSGNKGSKSDIGDQLSVFIAQRFGQLAASFATKPTKPRKHEEAIPCSLDLSSSWVPSCLRDFVVAFRGLDSMNRLRFLVHVVHQDVLAERIRGREIRLAFADLGDTADEAYEIVVAGQHEGVDHDPAFPARRHFRARFGDDERVEAEGVLVNAAIRLRQRRRLAVGDHDDLPHVFPLAIENPAGEPEAFASVRVVGADADAAELRQWDFLG